MEPPSLKPRVSYVGRNSNRSWLFGWILLNTLRGRSRGGSFIPRSGRQFGSGERGDSQKFLKGSFIRRPRHEKTKNFGTGASEGAPTPKILGSPKRDFSIVRCKKMKIGKNYFWGVGTPPHTLPTPKNRNRPFGTLGTFGENSMRLRACKLEIYDCKHVLLYNGLQWDFEKFKTLGVRIGRYTIFNGPAKRFGES